MADLSPSSLKELRSFIHADTVGNGTFTMKAFCGKYFFEPSFRFIFWLRVTRYCFLKRHYVPFFFSRAFLKRYSYKCGFDISYRTQIGKGLHIAHFGTIIIASDVVLGENCCLRPGLVIGKSISHANVPMTIGSNVQFGVGSKIIGATKIGDYAFIGATAVVTKDVPDYAVVAGIPAKVLRINSPLTESQ